MNKVIKVPTLKKGGDSEAAKLLISLFAEAQNGLRKVVAVGLACFEIKGQLKHGQFQPWLAVNCPGISLRSLKAYMQLTKNVLAVCGFKTLGAYFKRAEPLPFSHAGEFLLLADADVPEASKELREKICAVIDGKSQSQLFFEFKQAEDDDDEAPLKKKRGRLKGQGGASKEQREAAAAREEQERLEDIRDKAIEVAAWLLENADTKGFGKLDEIDGGEKAIKKLSDAVSYSNNFLDALKKSRKQ